MLKPASVWPGQAGKATRTPAIWLGVPEMRGKKEKTTCDVRAARDLEKKRMLEKKRAKARSSNFRFHIRRLLSNLYLESLVTQTSLVRPFLLTRSTQSDFWWFADNQQDRSIIFSFIVRFSLSTSSFLSFFLSFLQLEFLSFILFQLPYASSLSLFLKDHTFISMNYFKYLLSINIINRSSLSWNMQVKKRKESCQLKTP